jgi:hypothetical protein
MRAASDARPVSRILYGVAAADGHSSRPFIAERLKRPTRKLGAPSPARIFGYCYPEIPSLFGLAPCGVCRASRHCCASGALLPHLFTLTQSFNSRAPGGIFSVALSVEPLQRRAERAAQAPSRTLSGTLLCGVRTFLSLCRAARENPASTAQTATIRSDISYPYYKMNSDRRPIYPARAPRADRSGRQSGR